MLRHTTSHVLAQALKRIYPNVQLAIGPCTKEGFYYDIDMDEKLSIEDFPKIEKEMKKIIDQKFPIKRIEVSKNEAIKLVSDLNQNYKKEILQDIKGNEPLSFYEQGEYLELCRGPHLENTSQINPKAFKLLSVAGAYWRGNEKNKMLQRIYGTAFEKQEDIKKYIKGIEEAKKRDHRKLGKELGLFALTNEGMGFAFFLPKGQILKNELADYWREIHRKAQYEEIGTPLILSEDLWHQSGHWKHYKDNMYTIKIDDKNFAIKPMNCPGAMLVYKQQPHSYKEFPIRYAEMGLVHRHENSGNLHGLMRVRCFTQDDAHIFMTKDQIEKEIVEIIELIDDVYKKMGFKYHVELSTQPENSMGDKKDWKIATNALENSLNKKNIKFSINEGDGAFYGPKIDFHIEDCLGRTWQCGTVQLDFQMPENFDLTYIGQDGQKHRPVVVHRVILGSIERFIGILIEHTGAKFPTWLSPVQVDILPITENHIYYAREIKKQLLNEDIRSFLNDNNDTFGKKIRFFATNKTPYAIIIGDDEVSKGVITVKSRDSKNQKVMKLSEFIEFLKKEINQRSMCSEF
jgi:threonyl-tRNA synthetase